MKQIEKKETNEKESKTNYSELFYEAELDLGILQHHLEEGGHNHEVKAINQLLKTITSIRINTCLKNGEYIFADNGKVIA